MTRVGKTLHGTSPPILDRGLVVTRGAHLVNASEVDHGGELPIGPRTEVSRPHDPRGIPRPAHQPSRGVASGISETRTELGGALGIAVLGSIGAAVYRSQMTSNVPVGVPVAGVNTARDTLGGAVVVARQLPDDLGARLLDAAREAFIQATHVTAAVCVAIAIGNAIAVAVLLRDRKGSVLETNHDGGLT